MTAALPMKKLFLSAGGYFGPATGLGALDRGDLGERRPVVSGRIVLPISLPEPFLWELHLSASADLAGLRLSLAGDDAVPPANVDLHAGRRVEVVGMAAGTPGRVRPLDFRLHGEVPRGVVQFLGVSLLSLADRGAPAAEPAKPARRPRN